MLFNSFEFLIFFPIVTLLYFLTSGKYRWGILLAASCVFYMAFIPEYILILFGVILVDYLAGIWIENADRKNKKLILLVSLIANISILFVFKYFNFFNSNLQNLANFLGWNYGLEGLSIILPIGLSFHTFQSMSYTFEVYYGRQKAERHLGIYSLYVLFYPQLVAGPIERPQNLLGQFRQSHVFNYKNVSAGLKLITSGLLKKVVIADNLAVFVNQIYGHPETYNGLSVLLATYFFAAQIFCDFSGYSDIARGCARVMGYELMLNFKRPYLSKSIEEFWRRWHISLSTWFRDYLYIPLGGNRVPFWRKQANVFIVFLVSGFWHGANWTFLVWGGLHGLYILIENAFKRINISLSVPDVIRLFVVFHLACFAWIFFRADSISVAGTLIHNLFVLDSSNLFGLKGLEKFLLVKCSILFMASFTFQWIEEKEPIWNRVARWPSPLRGCFYSMCIILFLLFGEFSEQNFIYFQF